MWISHIVNNQAWKNSRIFLNDHEIISFFIEENIYDFNLHYFWSINLELCVRISFNGYFHWAHNCEIVTDTGPSRAMHGSILKRFYQWKIAVPTINFALKHVEITHINSTALNYHLISFIFKRKLATVKDKYVISKYFKEKSEVETTIFLPMISIFYFYFYFYEEINDFLIIFFEWEEING